MQAEGVTMDWSKQRCGADRSGTRLPFRWPARETGKIVPFPFPVASGWHAPHLADLNSSNSLGLQTNAVDLRGFAAMFRALLEGR